MRRSALAWLAAAAVALLHANAAARPAVWLDIDTANGTGDVDDGLMLIQALRSPEIDVVGVSTVFGNTDVAWATHVANDIVERFAPGKVGVFRGAPARGQGKNTDAVRAMAAALRGGEPVTILAVGPVTNVAALIESRPELVEHIERVVVVAGKRPGQVFVVGDQSPETAPPDFNFELDPGAMNTLLNSGVDIVLAPWEVSSKIHITREDLERLARDGGRRGAWVARTSRYWIERTTGNGMPGFNPYDSLALAHVVWPDLVEGERLRVSIDRDPASGGLTLSGDGRKHHLHARPLDDPRKDGRVLTYLHTPASSLKGELLARLTDDEPPVRSDTGGFDVAGYADLLDGAVDWERGLVDYDAIRERQPLLDRVVASLATADTSGMTEDEELALYVNAYNVFTLKLITDHWPTSSIFLIPEHKRWKAVRWELGGETVSLDVLEHRMIRARWDEPRIHFALVCAAEGCPPLRPVPFDGWWLDAQLDDQCRWAHRLDHVMEFELGDGEAEVTPLYKWYGIDWATDQGVGGDTQRGVTIFAGRYHRPLYFATLMGMDVDLDYQGYAWTLNDAE